MNDVFEKLREPFKAEEIEWRVQRSGIHKSNGPWAMVLAYVTNRAIMDRLDYVIGAPHWQNIFEQGPDGGVICGISIRVGDEWITKWDGATNTEIESVKGGLSDSMKRAAVQWGIGRYLYGIEAGWANINQHGKYTFKTKEDNGFETWHKWDPPKLPDWALPKESRPASKLVIDENRSKICQVIEDNKDIINGAVLAGYRLDYGKIKTEEDSLSVLKSVGKFVNDFRKEERKAMEETTAEEMSATEGDLF